MNLKSLLILFVSGLYLFTCHYWYCCKVKAACYGCAVSANEMVVPAIPKVPVVDERPLVFQWSDATPILTAGFGKEKTDWLSEKSGDNLLEITGEYAAEEMAPDGFKNMGLARADAVRKLLLLELPDERIRLNSKVVPKEPDSENKTFSSITVRWMPLGTNGSDIIDFGQKAVILFPSNSIKKETNPAIDDYLSSISKKVLSSGETIFITGHTDNTGEVRNNLRLGLNRAMRIRRILRQTGVPREQIVVNSKGEQEPVASNDTESGRYQNRRVVLEIK